MTSTLPTLQKIQKCIRIFCWASNNKVNWLQKGSAFQFPKPYTAYFIARPHFILNRTEIYWNFFCEPLHDIYRCCFVSKAWNFFSLCLSWQMVCDQLHRLNLIHYGIGSWRNSQAFVCKISTSECGLCFLDINFILSIWALLTNILLVSIDKVCSKLDTLFTDVVFICHPFPFMILSSLPRSEKVSWYWTCI